MPRTPPPRDPDETQVVMAPPAPAPPRPPASRPGAAPPAPQRAPAPAGRGRFWIAAGVAAVAFAGVWSLLSARWVVGVEARASALEQELRSLRAEKLAAEERAFAAERARDAAIAVQEQAVRPRAGVSIVDLGPARTRRETPEAEIEVALPLEGPPALLLVEAPGRGIETGFSVEILDARERRIWQRDRLSRDPRGRIPVLLPERSLDYGRHVVVLRVQRAGERQELGRWTIQIVSSR